MNIADRMGLVFRRKRSIDEVIEIAKRNRIESIAIEWGERIVSDDLTSNEAHFPHITLKLAGGKARVYEAGSYIHGMGNRRSVEKAMYEKTIDIGRALERAGIKPILPQGAKQEGKPLVTLAEFEMEYQTVYHGGTKT